AAAIRHQYAARVAEAEYRLEARRDIVGEERDGASGRHRGEQRVADAMRGDLGAHVLVQADDGVASEILLLVEERESTFLGGQRGRGEIGRALDRLQPMFGERHRVARAVARAAQDERVGEPGDAEADASL